MLQHVAGRGWRLPLRDVGMFALYLAGAMLPRGGCLWCQPLAQAELAFGHVVALALVEAVRVGTLFVAA